MPARSLNPLSMLLPLFQNQLYPFNLLLFLNRWLRYHVNQPLLLPPPSKNQSLHLRLRLMRRLQLMLPNPPSPKLPHRHLSNNNPPLPLSRSMASTHLTSRNLHLLPPLNLLLSHHPPLNKLLFPLPPLLLLHHHLSRLLLLQLPHNLPHLLLLALGLLLLRQIPKDGELQLPSSHVVRPKRFQYRRLPLYKCPPPHRLLLLSGLKVNQDARSTLRMSLLKV